jgi:hypothetical protein
VVSLALVIESLENPPSSTLREISLRSLLARRWRSTDRRHPEDAFAYPVTTIATETFKLQKVQQQSLPQQMLALPTC